MSHTLRYVFWSSTSNVEFFHGKYVVDNSTFCPFSVSQDLQYVYSGEISALCVNNIQDVRLQAH